MTTAVQLPELRSSSANSFIYYGDREGWHIALSVHRDSEAIDRSNWEVITADVLAVPDDGDPEDGLPDAAVESMGHWAVGWVEYLLVRPGSSAERRALEWAEKLDNYPIADEEHCSELEWREEWCVRCDYGTREDHDSDSWTRPCKFRSRDDAEDITYRWKHRHDQGRDY